MKEIKKKTLCVMLLLFTATVVWAAKSSGAIHIFPQPDGTTIKVRLLGDEHVSWYQTPDGVLLVRGYDKAFYVAEVNADGVLKKTAILAHDMDHRTNQELALVKAQRRDAFMSAVEREMAANAKSIPGYPSKSFCPHNGVVRVPVILMQYSNMDLSLERDVIEDYFNGTTKTPLSYETRFQGYGSVSQYFKDASFGKFELVFDIYGPYTTNYGHDYYGKKSGKSFTLLTEAVKKADGDIDFSKYDSDGNGKVDMVYVFYAGTGASTSGNNDDIWPSCWYSTYISTDDGKSINVIGAANELRVYADESPTGKNLRAGIGTTCHEISHGLGLPDLYNTGKPKNPETGQIDYSNGGPEDWDLMDGGENLYNGMWPCIYTAWERDVMGWIDVEDLTEPTDITIYPLDDPEGRGKAYRITNPANPNEYYIIENNFSDAWNTYQSKTYGSGLMIYHLNSQPSGFSMAPNNVYGKPNITILPADGYIMGLGNRGETIIYNNRLVRLPSDYELFDQNYFTPEMKGDPYPGSKGVTSLVAYNNYTKVDGDKDMVDFYPINDIIKHDDGSISFKFMSASTSIDSVGDKTEYKDGKIYSLDGRYLGTNPSVLPSGIYIQNGHKVKI